ncbi:MAG: maleylpyruvate isomerase N-terminal domain-containing protein [Actinobacteria bacterium]|nr:maleylpyruvate isomerase N-terminal domain-containing protein [Actinomycetota bacterium]
MTIPTRDEAIRTLDEGHRAVGDLMARLSDDDLVKPATIGGGEWSAKDLLGHLTSWEEIALASLDEWRRGERPGIEDVFRAEDVDRINAENVGRKAAVPADRVRSEAARVHRELVAAIDRMADDEWRSKAPYETERRTTLAALLGSILGAPKRPFGHAFAHLPGLEAYVTYLASPRTNA